MNKLIFLASICLAAASCGTLKLSINTDAPDGSKLCATSDVTLFADEGDDIYTAMAIKAGAKDTVYAISITCCKDTEEALFRKGGKMIFQLQDGSQVVIKNMADSYHEVENAPVLKSTPVAGVAYSYYYTPWAGLMYASPYEYHGYVPTPGVKKTTSSYGLYLIDKSQLMGIINKGVTDYTLEAADRNFKMEHPENASGLYAQLYEFLLEKVR